jgi:ribosomal protein S18 acetylase RimI-like enzyme
MEIRSLACRTDLIFPRFEGIVTDRGEYLVVRTPAIPGFYWGNYLLFAQPPAEDSLPGWKRLLQRKIADVQPTEHCAFGWDSPTGEGAVEPFLADGFILAENAVLSTDAVLAPRHYNADVEIRPLATDADWAQALENHVALRQGEFSETEYRLFKARQLGQYRRMTEAGVGTWFGGFAEGWLVADLGVFTDETLARLQQVGTHPDFRNRGICATLVYESARHALTRLGAERLVITADEHYHAGRIYESLGFRRTERQLGVELRTPHG